jgi:hypothetical protein
VSASRASRWTTSRLQCSISSEVTTPAWSSSTRSSVAALEPAPHSGCVADGRSPRHLPVPAARQAETWAYSFDPARYDAIANECATFNRESNPKPMHIKASVEVCSAASTSPEKIDINKLAQAKHHKVISQPSAPEQPSSSSYQPRRGGLRGGGMLNAEDFYYEFDVTDGAGRQGHAVLHLTYYPIKEGVETLPKGCKPGFDVRFVPPSPPTPALHVHRMHRRCTGLARAVHVPCTRRSRGGPRILLPTVAAHAAALAAATQSAALATTALAAAALAAAAQSAAAQSAAAQPAAAQPAAALAAAALTLAAAALALAAAALALADAAAALRVHTMPPYIVPSPHAGWRRRWQSRLLKDERLRHLSFMESSKLSRCGRGGMQKELSLLLDRVGHRVSGELLLDGNYAVNKMKSELLHAGEESSSGSVKLVQALTKPAPAEWEYVGSQQKLIERYTQWLQKHEKHDDNYRFVFEDVEKASSPLSGYVRPLHPLHPLHRCTRCTLCALCALCTRCVLSALCTLCTLCVFQSQGTTELVLSCRVLH